MGVRIYINILDVLIIVLFYHKINKIVIINKGIRVFQSIGGGLMKRDSKNPINSRIAVDKNANCIPLAPEYMVRLRRL